MPEPEPVHLQAWMFTVKSPDIELELADTENWVADIDVVTLPLNVLPSTTPAKHYTESPPLTPVTGVRTP